jgi:hypothetical protein
MSYRCTGADGKSSSASRTIAVAHAAPSAVQVSPQYLSSTAEATLGPAFDAAVAVLTSVITGPVPGVDTVEAPWVECGNTTVVAHRGEIRVLVSVEPIDGAGGVLALSSPCWVRSSDHLPFIGFMKLDSADVSSLTAGQLRRVVLHELFHVFGFGTLFAQPGLPAFMAVGSTGPYFTGASGRAAFRDFDGGAGYQGDPVPLEDAGAAASVGKHWRTAIFGSELMTSYLGPTSPLSRTTLEALDDLGWWVNAELADPFLVDTSAFGAVLLAPAEVLELGDDAAPLVPRVR